MENVRENAGEASENKTRSSYTPTKSVRISSAQNNDPCSSRNNKNRGYSWIFLYESCQESYQEIHECVRTCKIVPRN